VRKRVRIYFWGSGQSGRGRAQLPAIADVLDEGDDIISAGGGEIRHLSLVPKLPLGHSSP